MVVYFGKRNEREFPGKGCFRECVVGVNAYGRLWIVAPEWFP
jgi:hypothetical protein